MLFLGVFLGSGDKDVKKFAETYQLTYPVGKDSGVAEALGVKGIPETVFIARDGKILNRHLDTIDYKELVSGIEEILK